MSKPLGLIDIRGRHTAWELIISNDIRSLPVNPFVIAAKNDINVLTYYELSEAMGKDTEFYETQYSPVAFVYPYGSKYYIAYNQDKITDTDMLRWTVMHELSHVFLNHVQSGVLAQGFSHDANVKIELDANRLTRRILSPSIVLHVCGCTSAEEISALCGIPLEYAKQRYRHLQDLRLRNAFLVSDLERDILDNYMIFISDYLAEKYNKESRPIKNRTTICKGVANECFNNDAVNIKL